MALRIGFDLDGVLADMEAELVRQAVGLFGAAVVSRGKERAADPLPPAGDTDAAADESPIEDVPADSIAPLVRLSLTPRQQRKLWAHVESIKDFWLSLDECETGAVARLAALSAELRWEIMFLTRRPETVGATAQVQTQRWLESKGFRLPSVYVVQGSRGRIAAALDLDIIVDDRPENCLDVVVDSTARAILVWRDQQEQLPATARRLGVGVVRSVGEALDVLALLDSKARGRPGVMSRVMRLLGLSEPTSA